MDKKSKIFFFILLLLVIVSVAFTYYRTMVARDYKVVNTEVESSGTE